MKYIIKHRDASKAQDILKRALKIQDVCKDKYKNEHQPIPKQNKESDRHWPLLTTINKRGVIRL